MINLSFSLLNSLIFFFAILLIFVVFRLLKRYIPPIIQNQRYKRIFDRYFSLFEFLVWVLFSIYTFSIFIKHNQYFAVVLFILLIILAVWSASLFFKDYIAGIIIKTNKNIELGDTILLNGTNGKLKELKFRYLVLENELSERIYIPYSKIIKQEFRKSKKEDALAGHQFEISIAKKYTLKEITERINEIIVCTPGVSLKRKAQIIMTKESNTAYTFEITVFVTDYKFVSEIKNRIKNTIL